MRRLGLTLEKGELCLKVVNSEAKPIHRIARDMIIKIESWSGIAKFLVAIDFFDGGGNNKLSPWVAPPVFHTSA